MWDFFNMRRRARQRSRQHTQFTETDSPSPGIERLNFLIRSASHRFFIPNQPVSESPPKCLSRIPCSNILYGDRVEDFSTNCWLENQLHRFGFPASCDRILTSPLDIETDDSVTSSSGSSTDTIGYSSYELDSDNELIEPMRPRLALEELFLPPGVDGDHIPCEPPPPPYTQFPDEPPPSYEEAVGCEDRRSNGTRSSSSSINLAIMW